MKIPNNKIELFIQEPASDTVSILVYGSDAGLVYQRVRSLMGNIVADPSDPFLSTEINYDDIKADVSLLADELSSRSLIGGRRLIRVRDIGGSFPKSLGEALLNTKGDNIALFEAGDLPASSAIRKFFEKEKRLYALPCYKDDHNSIKQVIKNILTAQGYRINYEALEMLASNFAGDRLVIVSEVEKLITYVGNKKEIEVDDIELAVKDSSELSLDMICLHTAQKDAKKMQYALSKAQSEGISSIAIIRAVLRYFFRLHIVHSLINSGSTQQQAISSLSPPVFFKQMNSFKGHLGLWNLESLDKVIAALGRLEAECKSTDIDHHVLCKRFFAILPKAIRA